MKNRLQTIGDLLAHARLTKNYTQGELAKLLGYSSPQYVSNWERGVCEPPLDKMHLIIKHLDLDPKLVFDQMMKDTARRLEQKLKLASSGRWE